MINGVSHRITYHPKQYSSAPTRAQFAGGGEHKEPKEPISVGLIKTLLPGSMIYNGYQAAEYFSNMDLDNGAFSLAMSLLSLLATDIFFNANPDPKKDGI